jgi:type IV secretion system protein VirB8
VSQFDIDLVTGPRRAARTAWIVAGCSTAISVLVSLALVVSLPLRRTEVFTVLVDKTTGAAERIYQVQPTGIEDEEAVKEALLVQYVSDRESYLRAGIQERLEAVQRMSEGPARASLVALWSSGNPDYPPSLYGVNSEVKVKIISVTFLQPKVAQVRLEKRLERVNQEAATQSFVATVGFDFDPRRERSIEHVWENPLGFTVTAYRVDAETLERKKS